ncbi:hypothetical protein ACFL56_02585 [Candidatus Margulisiibacteriota bacterium]
MNNKIIIYTKREKRKKRKTTNTIIARKLKKSYQHNYSHITQHKKVKSKKKPFKKKLENFKKAKDQAIINGDIELPTFRPSTTPHLKDKLSNRKSKQHKKELQRQLHDY